MKDLTLRKHYIWAQRNCSALKFEYKCAYAGACQWLLTDLLLSMSRLTTANRKLADSPHMSTPEMLSTGPRSRHRLEHDIPITDGRIAGR
jgi:hypothetical protein